MEKIYYDEIEKKFNSKYNKIILVIILAVILFYVFVLQGEHFLICFAINMVLIFPHLPNYLLLKKIVCPSCNKNYFTPFFAGKEEVKSLLKSNPKCASCNYEAEIISEYKIMY